MWGTTGMISNHINMRSMWEQCHPTSWEWLIRPIYLFRVMTGGWCKWHCFTHINSNHGRTNGKSKVANFPWRCSIGLDMLFYGGCNEYLLAGGFKPYQHFDIFWIQETWNTLKAPMISLLKWTGLMSVLFIRQQEMSISSQTSFDHHIYLISMLCIVFMVDG